MATLLVRLVAPMQSWGSQSRFDRRDTNHEPTKSGVLGLVCAAMGRERSEPIDDLASLRMGVRVDREGIVAYDYQTAQNVIRASVDLQKWKNARARGRTTGTQATVVSRRYFLADAAFLVGLEGDEDILEQVDRAMRNPRWALFLGRKGYLPGEPVHFPKRELHPAALERALAQADPLVSDREEGDLVRYAIELPHGCSPSLPWQVREVWDQPIAPFSQRRFASRLVGEVARAWGEVPECT